MPILHRHVGSPQHAWAADNGKPVFRSSPSHQRLMRFSITMHGDINLSPLLQPGRIWEYEDPSAFATLVFPAASFNAHATENADDFDEEAYYNGTGYDNLWLETSLYWRDRDSGGDLVRMWQNVFFHGGIVWDAATWHWAFQFSAIFRVRRYSSWWPTAPSSLFGDGYALYESTPSAQGIRAGNGIDLHFSGLTGNCEAGLAECLGSAYFTLSSQYA